MCMFSIPTYTLFVLSIPHLKEWAFRTSLVNKVTKYKDVHAKAQCKDTSLEVDLHERNEVGTE